jgi:alanine racemase
MIDSPHNHARLTVRLGAVKANYAEMARRAGSARVAPVVKADGYGLGAAPIAQALATAGADTFFVARIEEGIALRRALPDVRIMVLDGARADVVPALVTHQLTPVLNALEELDAYSAAARGGKLDAALQLDTGISRSGLSREAIGELRAAAKTRLANINLVMILSQLACADEPEHPQNARQLSRFREALTILPPAPASLAASAGVHLGRDYIFDAVRPGVALYGGNPVPAEKTSYRPVAKLTARVLQVRNLEAGGSVGYGATFTAAKPTALAIIALGYGDGFPRLLQTHGNAAINGTRVPLAGRISMDLMALDISALGPGTVKPGTEVEFIGDTITVDDVAAAVNTIPHEVLNWLSHPRAQRVYEG